MPKDQEINSLVSHGPAGSGIFGLNNEGTDERIDTLLTQLGSLDVRISPPPAPLPRGPLVYFVRRGQEVKIGFTHRLSQRIVQIGGGELLGTLPGTTTTERIYHARFAHLREHGEWFLAEPELLDAIKAETIPPNSTPKIGYAHIARAFNKQTRPDKNLVHSRLIFVQTNVGFWLNMLAGGETPERLTGLEQALGALARAKASLT